MLTFAHSSVALFAPAPFRRERQSLRRRSAQQLRPRARPCHKCRQWRDLWRDLRQPLAAQSRAKCHFSVAAVFDGKGAAGDKRGPLLRPHTFHACCGRKPRRPMYHNAVRKKRRHLTSFAQSHEHSHHMRKHRALREKSVTKYSA